MPRWIFTRGRHRCQNCGELCLGAWLWFTRPGTWTRCYCKDPERLARDRHMSQRLVIIRIHDDQDDRDWWETLNLPSPDYWGDAKTFGHEDAYVELELDVRLAPGE
jgi:hypothetical protein